MQQVKKCSLITLFFFLSVLGINLVQLTLPALAAEPQTMDLKEFNGFLEQSKGQVVVVNFFATWCPPCKAEIPVLQRLFAKHPADKFKLIALSMDEDTESVLPFMQKLGAKYPVFLAQADLAQKFEIYAIPRLLIFDKTGTVVKDHEGMMTEEEMNGLVEKYLEQ